MLAFMSIEIILAEKSFAAAFLVTMKIQLFGMNVSFMRSPTTSRSIPAEECKFVIKRVISFIEENVNFNARYILPVSCTNQS